jgi:hypothetical protein
MKAIMITMLTFFLASGVSAQDNAKSKKEVKKIERDSIANREYQLTKNMIDSMNFVLEADYLSNQYGHRIPVTSTLNFIMVDSTHAVLQTGRNSGMGYNGVGGVTAEGSISNWNVKTDKKNKSFFIQMDVMSNIGIYNVFMNVSSSGKATARLSGLWPGQLVWDGYIVPAEETRTYKGRSF